jgi:hypothetical protein
MVPVLAGGILFTVIVVDIVQPLSRLYVIVVVPGVRPETTPDVLLIVPTAVLLLLQVPPVIGFESAVVAPMQSE